jgi:hypothetical protein
LSVGKKGLAGLDRLINGKSARARRSPSMSPNDALVQVALPLVLILAIITRLMVIEYTEAVRNKGPRILEMWKQQMILRIDTVMEGWEKEAQLGAFPDFHRVQWDGAFPDDQRFADLCSKSLEMNDREKLQDDLYNAALAYEPPAGEEETALQFITLYDPLARTQPDDPSLVSEDFVINEQRRDYAHGYVADRVSKWKEKVEGLQWAAVAQCADRLPLVDSVDADEGVSAQLLRVSDELKKRGYPLLNSLVEEYVKSD